MECHAGEADTASPTLVERLGVLEHAALRWSDGMQHGVGRGQTTNSPAVADVGRRLEPTSGVARRGVLKHGIVERADYLLQWRIDGRRVAELRPDMA